MERNIKLISAFNFFTDFKFHSAVLVIYFAQVTGSYISATSLFSVIMVSAALFEIPTGIFSDMIGRKKTAMMGAIAATISAILYASGHSYWTLFIGALFEGLSRAWYSGNNEALLYESVSQSRSNKDFAHHLGKTSAMFQLALMIGAVLGSVMAQWSFTLIMWLSVIPQMICLVLSFGFTDPQAFTKNKSNIYSHIKLSSLHLWNNKKLRLLGLADILGFAIGEASFQFNTAFIATLWPLWAVGFSRFLSFGGAFLSFRHSGKIIRTFGEYNILIFANAYTRIVNFIAYGIPSIVSPILSATPSLLYGAYEVSKTSLAQTIYTKEQRATLASITSFFGSLLYGIFAIILGYVADRTNPGRALVMAQCCMLIVLAIQIKLKRIQKNT
jgi:MFS family permease